ncbi:MAG: DUF6300 family protein [Pseudonocardia sp.]
MTGPPEPGEPRIELHSSLPCHLCGGKLLFAARVPMQVEWIHGQSVAGARTVTLCPRCHRDDPAAQGVLAFFTVHECITQETVSEAGAVIREWIERATKDSPVYTDEDLDEDIRRWEAGDM